MNRSISISLPDYLIDELTAASKASKRSVSSLVLDMMNDWHYANLARTTEAKLNLCDRVWREKQ